MSAPSAKGKALTETRRVEDPLEDQLRNIKGTAFEGEYRVWNIEIQRFLGYVSEDGKAGNKLLSKTEWRRISDAMQFLGWSKRETIKISSRGPSALRGFSRPIPQGELTLTGGNYDSEHIPF